jgi:NADPH:quinone reductase-like Zn-dependent oxidoreductase
VGLLAGPVAELNLGVVLMKRLSIIGTVLRSRALEEKIAVAQAFEREVVPLFDEKKMKPVIDATFPMSRLQEAFARMSSNSSFGKLVIEWAD